MEYSRYVEVVETRKIVHWQVFNYQLRYLSLSQRIPSGGRIRLKSQTFNKNTRSRF